MREVRSCLVFPALAVFITFSVPSARAGCTGSSPTWTSTPDSSSLQSCINSASNGDTINVSAGTATWTTQVNITSRNHLTISGASTGPGSSSAGTSSVTITDGGGGGFTIYTSDHITIQGLTLHANVNDAAFITINSSTNTRITNDTVSDVASNADETTCIFFYDVTSTANTGVVDHTTQVNCHDETWGGDIANDANMQNLHWTTNVVGTGSAIYYENNTYTFPDPQANSYWNTFDCFLGGSFVVRFNVFNGGRIESHGIQADHERGCHSYELYNNSMTNPQADEQYWPFSQRSATGFVFHNTLDNKWLQPYMRIDGPRLNEGSIAGQVPTWQFCDGLAQSASVSGYSSFSGPKSLNIDTGPNNGSTTGYRCRDQIGAGPDSSTWASGWSTTPPSQGSQPLYVWNNSFGGSEMTVTLSCEGTSSSLCTDQSSNVIQNRDYYLYNTSSCSGTQTTGVCQGTLASRASNCTTGVGYWATDQGSWNGSGSGGQGQFYECTATNTWTQTYTPYTYPHPLVSGGGSTSQPAAPTILNATVVVQ